MLIHTLAGIFVIMLLAYIIYLHIQLTKRNIFIESTVKRLSGIEKSRSMDEMIKFLQEIQRFSKYSAYFKDIVLDDSSLNFILGKDKNMITYLHYTKDLDVAKKILSNGFIFEDSFYKTAIPVSKDELDIKIKHNSRKYFGDYLIVICLSDDIVNFYSMELKKAGIKNISFENILTEAPPVKNENSDLVYTLSNQFIKGYINHRTGEIAKNPRFDPWYNSPSFMKNIELFR